MDTKMQVLVVSPRKSPVVTTIRNTASDFEQLVGGQYEVVYLFRKSLALIYNDDAKQNGKPITRLIMRKDDIENLVFYGTFVLCGVGESGFTGFTDEQAENYRRLFNKFSVEVAM